MKTQQNQLSAEKLEPWARTLEILIISNDGRFQEVEIVYGNKKVRRKITKHLPENLATNDLLPPQPSMKMGATSLINLKTETPKEEVGSLLKEKFLRALAKINQLLIKVVDSEGNFDYARFWDGAKRIDIDRHFIELSEFERERLRREEAARRIGDLNTGDKAILVAVINSFRPQDQKVDRVIVSSKFAEISNKEEFKKFVDEILMLLTDDEKLANTIFPGVDYKILPLEKKEHFKSAMIAAIKEQDDVKRSSHLKFLIKVTGFEQSRQQSGVR